MNHITTESVTALKPSSWVSVNYVVAPDLRLLRESIETYGWITPIVVRKEDSTVIDGYHRWLLASKDPKGIGKAIPVAWVSCDQIDAMILHITLNRARGSIVNRDLSALMKKIIRSRKYSNEELRMMLEMTLDEFDVLSDGSLIKRRNIKKHEYSMAWVPIETSGSDAPIKIERPPNKDS